MEGFEGLAFDPLILDPDPGEGRVDRLADSTDQCAVPRRKRTPRLLKVGPCFQESAMRAKEGTGSSPPIHGPRVVGSAEWDAARVSREQRVPCVRE